MSLPVSIQPSGNQFLATVLGMPNVNAIRPTRSLALDALREELELRVSQGDILFLDVERKGVTELSGIFADDPTLLEICADVYRERDDERGTELGM